MLGGMQLPLHLVAQLPVSAASGIVSLAGRLWVVADDEIALTSCALDGSDARTHALPFAALPDEHEARKAQKADHEAMFCCPDGALYVLASGSTEGRVRGVRLAPGAEPRELDLRPLYAALLLELPELNVEGVALTARHLVLLSRGNGARRDNAVVRLDRARALAELVEEHTLTPRALHDVVRVELGELHGAPLGFTDAAPHPDGGVLFTAAAEASPDTYRDGHCTGSVVGMLSEDGVPGVTALALPAHKLEGLCVVARSADQLELRLVADPDDRGQRAPLLRASWPLTLSPTHPGSPRSAARNQEP
jgi:hypothetical protein